MGRTRYLFAALAALWLVGCGGGGGGPSLTSRLTGTWELRQQSTNGGQSFTDVTNGFRFTFNSDGTWNDTDGQSGTWQLQGSLLVVSQAGTANLYAAFSLENLDDTLRLTFTDSNGTATGHVSLYQRVQVIRG